MGSVARSLVVVAVSALLAVALGATNGACGGGAPRGGTTPERSPCEASCATQRQNCESGCTGEKPDQESACRVRCDDSEARCAAHCG